MDFEHPDLHRWLEESSDEALDALPYGVIGLASDGAMERYNAFESKLSGMSAARVLNRHFFTEVAPCTNNFMVAQRFEDLAALDETLPYVFTLKMRPRKVTLRLLRSPDARRMYILVRERA
ncbi:MAG: Photoactive yellow protein [Myxococcaceae bacterium]|nr:Photoactive yellow protein [Myxococcaceae bacterium]